MPVFLDTNIIGYLLDSGKKERSRRLASAQPHVSVQVLNEFVAVCRKTGKDRETAYALADAIANASTVHDITLATYRLAQARHTLPALTLGRIDCRRRNTFSVRHALQRRPAAWAGD